METRTDFMDCWNILDEIGEMDRRIATLRNLMGLAAPGGQLPTLHAGAAQPAFGRASLAERYAAERHGAYEVSGRPIMGRRRLPLAGRR